jgi:hypothetical protein
MGALGEPVLQKNYLFAASRNLGKSIKYLFLINFYATSDDVTVYKAGWNYHRPASLALA